jgi:glutamine amidotransferase PdxT
VKTGFAEMMKGGVFIRAPRFKGLAAAVEVLSATPQGECAKAVFWRSPSTPN